MQQTISDDAIGLSQWLTLDDFPKTHTNFSRSQLEWLHRNRDINGFSKAFRKIGKRRYVHAGLFADCLLESAGSGT
jgi:hypothetical protein